MEHCDRHGGDHIFYEYHRTRQADCPLCAALDRINDLEQVLANRNDEIEQLMQKVEDLEGKITTDG